MSYEKIRIYSVFLLLGIAALFVPVTALQNSIANAQQYYPEYEEKEYYNQEYYPYQDDEKNAPIVNVEKKLFVCNNVTDSPNDYQCEGTHIFIENGDDDFVISYPSTPDSGEYIPCNNERCPFIDESDFSVQIFKDVATVRDLSSEGTPVNLDKFHYTVTERSIEDIITANSQCSTVGFSHDAFVEKITDDSLIFYAICVNYVGDCEGTIYSDEVKTCTVENYIFAKFTDPILTDGNTADDAQSSSLSQQSNNQVLQSQSHTLRDIISD